MLLFLFHASLWAGDLFYSQTDWVTFRAYRFVRCIACSQRKAYIGTTRGLIAFDFRKQQWDLPITVSDGLPSEDVLDVFPKEESNRVLVKTSRGIHGYAYWHNSWSSVYGPTPFDTLTKQRPLPSIDNLYIPYPFFFDGYSVKDASFKAYPITVTLTTDTDDLFIGTWGIGIGYGRTRMKQVEMQPYGLWADDVACIASLEEDLWFGSSQGGGVTQFCSKSGKWSYFHAPDVVAFASNRVLSLSRIGSFLLVGTDRGALLFERRRSLWEEFEPSQLRGKEIHCIASVGDSAVWLGTNTGLYSFHKKKNVLQWHRRNPANLELYCISPEGNDGVWGGTGRGLYRYRIKEERVPADSADTLARVKRLDWQPILSHEYFQNRRILSLLSMDSILWVGSEDGLVRLSKQTNLTKTIGGPGTPIHGPVTAICKSDTCLWIGTLHGVVQLNQTGTLWRIYDTRDGLIDNHVLVLKKQDEYIWIGTPNGVTRCNWREVQRKKGI